MEWLRINNKDTEYEFQLRDFDVKTMKTVTYWKTAKELNNWEKDEIIVRFINILKVFPVEDIKQMEKSITNIQQTVKDFILE